MIHIMHRIERSCSCLEVTFISFHAIYPVAPPFRNKKDEYTGSVSDTVHLFYLKELNDLRQPRRWEIEVRPGCVRSPSFLCLRCRVPMMIVARTDI